MKIAFIGSGVMGEAIIQGILNKNLAEAGDIMASDISTERLSYLRERYGVDTTPDNRTAVKKSEIIVLAIKPVAIPDVMNELKGYLKPEQLVLSIAAGITTASLCQGLDHRNVIRAMPNMPAQIGEGMIVWTSPSDVKDKDRQKTRSILSSLGEELFVADERYIDMATAVSGSGPAYVFTIIESMVDAAVHIGLPHEMAQKLVLQTISGSTHLAQKSGKHPAELRNLVTSPGGTTAEGLFQLEKGGLRAIITQSIIAGYEKSKALGKKE